MLSYTNELETNYKLNNFIKITSIIITIFLSQKIP